MPKKYPYLVCGWLAPNGDFTECKYEEHRYIARTLFKCDERDLEKKRLHQDYFFNVQSSEKSNCL